MKRLIKKLLIVFGVAIASFFAFAYSFGWFSVSADMGEILANNEAILEETVEGDSSALSQEDETADNSFVGSLTSSTQKESEDDILNGIIPETEASKWFKEKIVPYIVEYGAALLGALSGLVLVLSKLKKSIANLVGAYNALKQANEDSEKTKNAVSAQDANIKEWQTAQNEEMRAWMHAESEERKKWQEEQKTLMIEGYQQITEAVTDKLDDIGETAHKILDVEEIAYEDNPVLVSKGTTKKIKGVIHNVEKKKETNESDA